MNYLIQQGYTPEQRVQIFNLASFITEGRNNICTEVQYEEIKEGVTSTNDNINIIDK